MSVQTDILTVYTLKVFISANYRSATVKRFSFAYIKVLLRKPYSFMLFTVYATLAQMGFAAEKNCAQKSRVKYLRIVAVSFYTVYKHSPKWVLHSKKLRYEKL